MREDTISPTLPWWRVGMVWLVLGGPALVVVAGIATAVIATGGADTVVKAEPSVASQAPAVQVRNRGAAE
jgi:hypothetical protein